jgi:cellobiose phosphorylase
LTVEPSLPAEWPGFELTWRHAASVYEIKVMRHEKKSAVLELDGVEVGFIPLDSALGEAGGTHHVTVRLPTATVDPDGEASGVKAVTSSPVMVTLRA